MTNEQKLAMLEEMMELDEGVLSENTDLSNLDEWDSLSLLSFMALMDDEFGKSVTGKEVRECKIVKDLLDMMEK